MQAIDPVYNPSLPFDDVILGGVKVGQIYIVNGKVLSGAKGFQLNFVCGLFDKILEDRDIAFHFNPRFTIHQVVRNTRKKNEWGEEECSSPTNCFPFTPGNPFEIMILVNDTEFRVSIDGYDFAKYKHRIPLSQITGLHIAGDIEIFKIHIMDSKLKKKEKCTKEKSLTLLGSDLVTSSEQQLSSFYNLSLPFKCAFPYEMKPGRIVYVSGRPTTSASRFHINFCCHQPEHIPNSFAHDDSSIDVALHFNPRFQKPDLNKVIQNTRYKGKWGTEDNYTPFFPFNSEMSFDISFLCKETSFVISANGQIFSNFHHILNYRAINHFEISGSVKIYSVIFE